MTKTIDKSESTDSTDDDKTPLLTSKRPRQIDKTDSTDDDMTSLLTVKLPTTSNRRFRKRTQPKKLFIATDK